MGGSCKTNSSDINKTFIIEPLSITGGSPTLSACTAMYTNFITPCDGSVVGVGADLYVQGIVTGTTFNANLYLSGGTDLYTVLKFTGGSQNCITDLYVTNIYGCSPITIKDTIIFDKGVIIKNNIVPDADNQRKIGTTVKRFREINALSGRTTLWTATTRVTTNEIDLGQDLQGNARKITANNSIIKNDCLNGGTY